MGMPHAKTNGRTESLFDPSQQCKADETAELSSENEISDSEEEDWMNGKSSSSSGNITLWESKFERVKWPQTLLPAYLILGMSPGR